MTDRLETPPLRPQRPSPVWERYGVYAFCAILILLRWCQAEKDLEYQQAIFSQPQTGEFQVVVSEEPEVILDREPGSHETGRGLGVYTSQVHEVRAVCSLLSFQGHPEPPVKLRCSFILASSHPAPVLDCGEVLDLEGKIMLPPEARNPGQFDYRQYLKDRGVAYVMYLSPGTWSKAGVPAQGPKLIQWASSLRRIMEDRIDVLLPYPQNALMEGLLLGERGPLPNGTLEAFLITGTVHILAVSGLITAFVAGVLYLFFRTLQLGRKGAAWVTLIGLGFFVLMTGAHPPACRAGLFSALALVAILLGRRIHSGTLLLVTAFLLAFENPFVLEDLSFQVSFLATAGLMVMVQRLMEKLSFLWKPAAILISTTVAAQLSVWCLLVFTFNQLSPYAIPANLLIVPLALFSVAGGLAFLAGSFLHPLLGKVFAAGCLWPLELLVYLAQKIAGLPGAGWVVASPPVWWEVLFHILLIGSFIAYWPRPRPEKPSLLWLKIDSLYRRAQKIIVSVFLLFLLVSTIGVVAEGLRPKPLHITFLDVGHGNAVVVQSPNGQVFVDDGGREDKGLDRYAILVSYLRHEGIQRVADALDTHPDADHVGGLVNLISAYPVGRMFIGEGARSDSRVYQEFLGRIHEKKIPLIDLLEGDHIDDLSSVRVEVLHPPKNFWPPLHADNNRSVVSLVSYASGPATFTLLLPGDLEKPGILELLKNHRPFPKIDWFMAAHHGRASGEPALCAEGFKPHFVVLSDWKDYPEDHRDFCSAVPDATVLSTANEGAIEVEVDAQGHRRYRSYLHPQWQGFSVAR